MANKNIQAKMKMPLFTIDTLKKDDGTVIPGIKRMFDIALALKDSVMQWGTFGIGKSEGVKQWNQDKVIEYNNRINKGEQVRPWNPNVCDVRLSMKEPVDMIGIPIINKDGSTVWATPSMWPREEDNFSGGTIHLDELNQGQPAILNAAFQLIQDRRLGDYKVPDGYIIIGSSNPPIFNSTVTEFSLPLSNRFSHFNITHDFDSWLNYRMNNNGNPDVMSFLASQDQSLLFDTKAVEEKIGDLDDAIFTDVFVTPRSWEVIEKLLALPDINKDPNGFSMEEKKYYATGRLGLLLTNRLFTYIADKQKYQSWKEILIDGKPFRDESTEQFWSVQISCLSAISNEKNDDICRKYVLNFIKATNVLKSNPYKVINITSLVRNKRISANLKLFNPIKDAPELISLISNALLA